MDRRSLTVRDVVEAYRAADADLPDSLLAMAGYDLAGGWVCERLDDKADLPPHWHRKRYVATTAGLAALHQMPLRVARANMRIGTSWGGGKALKIAGRWVATWVRPCPDEGHKPTFDEVLRAVMDRSIRASLNTEAFGLGDGDARWGGEKMVIPARSER